MTDHALHALSKRKQAVEGMRPAELAHSLYRDQIHANQRCWEGYDNGKWPKARFTYKTVLNPDSSERERLWCAVQGHTCPEPLTPALAEVATQVQLHTS